MMYTFEIGYDDGEDFRGYIQFCAETTSEAVALFEHWHRHDMGIKKFVPITCVDIFYDKEDAKEYDENYGCKEDY